MFPVIMGKGSVKWREGHTRRDCDGDPERTRTSDLRFRKPTLYPAELRGRRPKMLLSMRSLQAGARASAAALIYPQPAGAVDLTGVLDPPPNVGVDKILGHPKA